jgi:hypothetical protein
MRSSQRDQINAIIFSGILVDAASGSGIAQPGGIVYTFIRNSVGNYTITFDPRILVISALAIPVTASGPFAITIAGTGTSNSVNPQIYNTTGSGVNGSFKFICTAIDKRI